MWENTDQKNSEYGHFSHSVKSRFPNELIFNAFLTNIPSFQDFPKILESIEVNGDMGAKCVDYRCSDVAQNCMETYGLKPSPT